MAHVYLKVGFSLCLLAVCTFLNSAVCSLGNLVFSENNMANGVYAQSETLAESDATKETDPYRESTGVVSQGHKLLRLSDGKIGYEIQVKGDGSYWVNQTEATEQLKVRISYRFFETISSGGDRFVVVSTPMAAPMDLFSHCCPQHLWSLGLEGESFNSFDATQDWITEVVLKLNVQGLPVGTYVFFYGYDRNPNGLLDFESLEYNYAVVNVKNPISVSLAGNPISGTAPQEVTFQVIVDDPKETMDTCSLVVGDRQYGCALYNKHTFTSEGI